MTHVPASSHGTTFNGGTITQPLVVADATVGYLDPILKATGEHTTLDLDNDGTLLVSSDDAALIIARGLGATTGSVYASNFDNSMRAALQGSLNTPAVFVEDTSQGRVTLLCKLPADSFLGNGSIALWYDPTTGSPALGLKSKDTAGVVWTSKYPLRQSSGALPTVAPVSGTAFQCSATQDVHLTVPVTYNPGVATTATCKVELSPDNVTFSTLVTVTQPVGTVFDGSIESVQLIVPAAWRVKLTVVNATLGTGTYY